MVDEKTFVRDFTGGPFPPKATIYFMTVARIFTKPGQPTWVYTGAIASDEAQGALFVQDEQLDPCAAELGVQPVNPMVSYLTPGKWGSVKVTAFSGTVLEFTTDSKLSGKFDVSTKQFTIDGVIETPIPEPSQPEPGSPEPVPTIGVDGGPPQAASPAATR